MNAARLQSLFASALELPAAARAAFMKTECADDPDLLRELMHLLAVDAQLDGMTARPIAAQLNQLLDSTAPGPSLKGMRVGPFELREELGRGGMGSVYRAERVDGSVSQVVAIKFVRRELLDANTIKRFQLERQLMATLDHLNIARLQDAAELSDGTPYFVMEYVAGAPITEYCAREMLSVNARVALLRKVCDAVAEAHHKLIVHRDLKPNNILVSDNGIPKLLDFGIAKPLSALPGVALSEETGTAHRYFSPHYAAPEQLTGEPVGVACDVYALGLLLFELLAGGRPFDFSELTAGQIERLITQIPPPAPSVVLARSTHSDAKSRSRQLRGDLDGIVLRCLRKAPHDRYASVEQLETDLGNYLDGMPVMARGGHRRYRMQKFVARNKLAVAATFLMSVALLSGIVAFAWQARDARIRAAEFEQVAKSQAEMLGQVDPYRAGVLLTEVVTTMFEAAVTKAELPQPERTQQIAAFAEQWRQLNATDTAREIIDRTTLRPAAETIAQRFLHQPVVEAALSQALADRYRNMGLNDASLPLQDRALTIRRQTLGEEHPDTLTSISAMAALRLARGELDAAQRYAHEALEKRRRVLGPLHPDTISSISSVGGMLQIQGKLAEAEPYWRQTFELRLQVLGKEHADTLIAMSNFGVLLQAQGKTAEAERYYRESLEIRRKVLGDKHPNTLHSINNVGFLLQAQGKFDEAEPYYREVVQSSQELLGEEHPDTLRSINNLGSLRVAQGHYADAVHWLVPVETASRRAFIGANAFRLSRLLMNLGNARAGLREFTAAETYLLEAQGMLAEAPGPFPKDIRESTKALVDLYGRWHSVNPGKGYDIVAAEWQRKLDRLGPLGKP